ncbi:MarR family winged helix-turn-helix transcriptional regulator [Mycobacterium stomatepiae]|uniref:MarR family transcriptional regulator n=1 Tax=Mycobacterium stomatepiae TaxID=470076 RepID=A0A7I7Q4D7_9MYCO|nr:MarR family transcriptional regulator [Mycobacterium stomatepiae]MCV7163610.1 MarR family transcriptional regulator [Mycobacterium stomatepiae]BBY21133.1 MarR family transcriptional regulator [Mycobacterium stomatepiae]
MARSPSSRQLAGQAAYDLRLLVSRLRRRLKHEYDNKGLTPSQISVISRLSHDGPASTSDLAAAEGVRRQSMAAIVNHLDKSGLLTRTPDPEDGRRLLVGLSSKAVRDLQQGRQLRDQWLADELRDRYTDEELQLIAAALTLLTRLA